MEKKFSLKLGLGLVLLMAAGFVKSEKPKHLLGLMNVDTQHSVLRIPTALALLYAGSRHASLKDTRTILSLTSVLYLIIGTIGSMDRKAGACYPLSLPSLIWHTTS